MSEGAPAVKLTVEGDLVTGEVSLAVAPGTRAQAQDRLLDEVLSLPLTQVATELGVVLAAPPHRFARPLPGKDAEGHTRFTVRGLAEGGRLVPQVTTGPRLHRG